jgi:Domain of unknown function (DUF4349)
MSEIAELEAVDAALAGRPVAPEHAELAELALLLRDERPEPRPAWANDLDSRAKRGFPARPKEPARWRVWFSPAVLGPVAAASVFVLIIVGVALSGGGSDDSGEGGGAGSVQPLQAEDSGAGAGASSEPEAARAGGSPGTDDRPNRSVQRSATITLAARSRDIDRVASDTGRIAASLGGFVQSSNITSSSGGDIQLRVPSNRLDTAIQRLSKLARVRELSRQSQDITSVVVSARERLNDARAERQSLLRQLAAATTVNETESIRARLRIVSREIAAARERLRSANNRANFADIGVTLVTSGNAAEDRDDEGTWTPGDAFDDSLRVLEVAAGVALLVLAVTLPLLVLGGLGWGAGRALTRRRRERVLDMA